MRLIPLNTKLPLPMLASAIVMINWWVIATARSDSPPVNVLLITVDDMQYNSPGCFGGPIADLTPNIDALAAGGMRFPNSHVQVAVCTPCRQVMLTGRYSHRNGAQGFTNIREDVPTLGERLSGAGYYNACVCKGIGPNHRHRWDVLLDYTHTGYGRDPEKYYQRVTEIMSEADRLGRPFFIMANAMDPHRPFYGSDQEDDYGDFKRYQSQTATPSKTYDADEIVVPGFLPDLPNVRRELSQYYSSCRRADDSVGAFLAALEDSGQASNTLVIFLSDHGMSFPYAKANTYLGSTKTNLIVRWPGRVAAGRVDDRHMVSTIDLTPTILDALALEPIEGVDGQSFLSVLDGDSDISEANAPDDVEHFDRVFTQYHQATDHAQHPMRCVQDQRYGYIFNAWVYDDNAWNGEPCSGLTWSAMVAAAAANPEVARRVEFFKHRVVEEFYDIQNDPDALYNLIDQSELANQIDQYRQRLEMWMVKTGDPALVAFQNRYDPEALRAFCESGEADSRALAAKPRRLRSEAYTRDDGTYDEPIAYWRDGQSLGLWPVANPDGWFEVVDRMGRSCLTTAASKPGAQSFLCFHVHDGFTTPPPPSLSVRITYLDSGNLNCELQYNGPQNSHQSAGYLISESVRNNEPTALAAGSDSESVRDSAPTALAAGSDALDPRLAPSAQTFNANANEHINAIGQWRTAELKIENPQFDNSLNAGADLRLRIPAGQTLHVAELEIRK